MKPKPPKEKYGPTSVGDSTPLDAPKTSATAEARGSKGRVHKPLPIRFRRDGFDYRQIYRQGDFAIYRQSWKGNEHSAAFEVVRIKRRQGFQIGARFVEPAEVYPNSEAWGVDGWTTQDKQAAFHKFREVVRERSTMQRFRSKECRPH